MDHAQTIALATDLLTEGRADDAAAMIDPLLQPLDPPATETGQLMLRALRARIAVVHRADPSAAFDVLPSRSAVADLCTCVRAEVALWRGWAYATRHAEFGEAARALRLLDEAYDLHGSLHDPSGQAWALLGRAQALFALDEYALLRSTLEDAAPRVERLGDTQARQWYHRLHVPALRVDERYEAAQDHVDALRTLGDQQQGSARLRGLVAAYEARLRLDVGRSPASVIETAETAEALLRRADASEDIPLAVAYGAHVEALLRRGQWDTAADVVRRAEDALSGTPTAERYLSLLRARMALHQGRPEEAEAPLQSLMHRDAPLPQGLSRATVLRLHGEVRARTDRPDEAQAQLQRAVRRARETGHRRSYLRTRCLQARTAVAQGDSAAARHHLDAVAEHASALHVLPTAMHRFAAEGMVAQADEQTGEARRAYEQALSTATSIQDSYRAASFRLALAQLVSDKRAGALAAEAASTFERLGADDEATVARSLSGEASASSFTATDDQELGALLVDTPPSVPLLASACLRVVAAHAPDRWAAVYRVSGDDIGSVVQERGTRPEAVSLSPSSATDGPVRWRALPPSSFYLGVEHRPDADGADLASRLSSWASTMGLALARASTEQQAPSAPLTAGDGLAGQPDVVAQSDAMRSVIERLDRARTSRCPVLLKGESGVGKRRLAEALHASGSRADGPVEHVAVADMQRHPTTERLFGHADASDDADATGAVHAADGGTLLIEDIDALPLSAQRTLLHLLDTGEAVPAGATDGSTVDVRLVATTTSDLDERIRNDRFLPGLRDRLSPLSITVPPLRERRADIPFLVRHFLDALRPSTAPSATITQPAQEALLRYDWPGNVRQLRNELERVLLLVQSEPAPTIDADMLLDTIVEQAQDRAPSATPDAADAVLHPNQTLSDVLSRTEKDVIEHVLRACDGQVTASAEVLGLSRQGLYKKMKRLGVEPSAFQPSEPASVS